MPIPKTLQARAKINLTLQIHGRLQDGFHALESLIVFAGLSDHLRIQKSERLRLTSSGRFAPDLPSPRENLLMRAAQYLECRCHIHLEKNIPVAAGLGGGSADAAALLRSCDKSQKVLDMKAMRDMGSDLPASLLSQSLIASGRGEILKPLQSALPPLYAVLVKGKVSLSTKAVYQNFPSQEMREAPQAKAPPTFKTEEDFFSWVEARPNDLQETAIAMLPPIHDALQALRATGNPRLVRMSGSGPTVFAVYRTPADAERAAHKIARAKPEWWVSATSLAHA